MFNTYIIQSNMFHHLIMLFFKQMMLTFSCIAFVSPLVAHTTVNSLFGDHMVLQQEAQIPVWGRASTDSTVKVRFNGEEVYCGIGVKQKVALTFYLDLVNKLFGKVVLY